MRFPEIFQHFLTNLSKKPHFKLTAMRNIAFLTILLISPDCFPLKIIISHIRVIFFIVSNCFDGVMLPQKYVSICNTEED